MICDHCGAALPPDALFCGECGRAMKSAAAADSVPAAVCEQCGFPISPDDLFCGDCGFVVEGNSAQAFRPNDTNAIERLELVDDDAEASAHGDGARDDVAHDDGDPDDDIEATRILGPSRGGERFVLQFSTGESFTVFGTGLIGRSPRPEPSEYFDQVIRIADASKSVSKTHLEFGQEAGSFWVKDRYSGNGTIIREPDSRPIRCHPERRYRLVRGSRVDMGEQFFIVS